MSGDTHYEQCAALLEAADRVVAPAHPFELSYDQRQELAKAERRDLKAEALIHAVLYLGQNVAHLVDILVAERTRNWR